jgi:hypothetical protein
VNRRSVGWRRDFTGNDVPVGLVSLGQGIVWEWAIHPVDLLGEAAECVSILQVTEGFLGGRGSCAELVQQVLSLGAQNVFGLLEVLVLVNTSRKGDVTFDRKGLFNPIRDWLCGVEEAGLAIGVPIDHAICALGAQGLRVSGLSLTMRS